MMRAVTVEAIIIVSHQRPAFDPGLSESTLLRIPLSHGRDMEMDSTLAPERAHQLADQRALIERARRGDASAHRALYDAHVEQIYRLTYRLTGAEHLARDVTQNTFVRAFASLDGFRGDSAFGTWLHSIAVSLSLNEIRRRKREWARNAPLEDATVLAESASRSDPLLRDKVMEAVNDLPPGCRAVFMMHDAEGYTHQEIAAALGINVGTSKAQLSRARGKLRVALAMFAEEWGS
jgi:RNA polymerase sigma-70 factor (ECF subfamily)